MYAEFVISKMLVLENMAKVISSEINSQVTQKHFTI